MNTKKIIGWLDKLRNEKTIRFIPPILLCICFVPALWRTPTFEVGSLFGNIIGTIVMIPIFIFGIILFAVFFFAVLFMFFDRLGHTSKKNPLNENHNELYRYIMPTVLTGGIIIAFIFYMLGSKYQR